MERTVKEAVQQVAKGDFPWLHDRTGELSIEEAQEYAEATLRVVLPGPEADVECLCNFIFALVGAYVSLKEKR